MTVTNVTAPTVLDIYSRVMAPAFDEKNVIGVSTVFQGLFGGSNGVTLLAPSSEDVTVNIMRGNEKISKWRVRGADSELAGADQADAKGQQFSEINRVFPLIEERSVLTAQELNKRLMQEQVFQPMSKQERARVRAYEYHAEHLRRIIRKFEVAASESFRAGQMTVTEGASAETLDFYRNSNLDKALSFTIDDVANLDIQAELLTACRNLRIYGKTTARGVMFGDESFVNFYNRSDIQTLADNRRLSFVALGMDPGAMPNVPAFKAIVKGGGQYEGWIKIGSWTLHVFTYIDGYETDAGVFTKYLPDDEVIVFSPDGRRDRYFGPSDLLPPDQMVNMLYADLFGMAPGGVAGKLPAGVNNNALFSPFMFYPSATKDSDKAYLIKTQAAPMFVPTQIDTVYRMTGGA